MDWWVSGEVKNDLCTTDIYQDDLFWRLKIQAGSRPEFMVIESFFSQIYADNSYRIDGKLGLGVLSRDIV